MQEEGRFIFAMQWIFDVEFDCICWISSSVIFILVMQERERERYVESKIFLNELEIRFSNCDFGIKKGFDGKLRI